MAAIPTNAPEIALPLPLFSCSVAFAKNVKAAGTMKPATSPWIKRTINSAIGSSIKLYSVNDKPVVKRPTISMIKGPLRSVKKPEMILPNVLKVNTYPLLDQLEMLMLLKIQHMYS